jgi:hypothetical protein
VLLVGLGQDRMGESIPGAKIIHERDLDALNSLPAGIHIVLYGPKEVQRPFPKNIWANTTCLQLFGDISLEDFLEQVELLFFSCPFFYEFYDNGQYLQDTHVTAKDLDRTQWEHRYHTVQVNSV